MNRPFVCFLFLGLITSSAAFAESMTLTTYYPAPKGTYSDMRTKRMCIGADCVTGTATVATDNNVYVQGNVGIGLTNPSERLEVAGNIRAVGNISATGTVSWTSDERLKTNIKPIPHALDMVKKMNGVYFSFKKTPDITNVGVIAQNIESALPEVVHTGNDGFKSVEYANLVAVLIEAIKEQDKKIAELEKKVKALR